MGFDGFLEMMVIPCLCLCVCLCWTIFNEIKSKIKSRKKNKEIINGIEWRKNFIARLFCKHEYQEYKVYGKEKLLPLNGFYTHTICKKCGEYKGEEFWEYPWEV